MFPEMFGCFLATYLSLEPGMVLTNQIVRCVKVTLTLSVERTERYLDDLEVEKFKGI